jgi:hypothetical protein
LDLQLRGQFRNFSFEILKPSTEFPFNSEGLFSDRNHNSFANVGESKMNSNRYSLTLLNILNLTGFNIDKMVGGTPTMGILFPGQWHTDLNLSIRNLSGF